MKLDKARAESPRCHRGMQTGQEPTTVIPKGKIVPYGTAVRAQRMGKRDFRAWLVTGDEGPYELCSCGWAPELGEHFAAWRERSSGRREPAGTAPPRLQDAGDARSGGAG